MSEIENPLEGLADEMLEINSAEDYWKACGIPQFHRSLAPGVQMQMDHMWDLAFKLGKAEGLAARDSALRTAAEERDEARATAKTETDQVLKLRAKVEEQRRSIEILREEVAAYQDNEKLLAQEKQDLAQIIEDIKSDVRYYASETLSGRRALAAAVGFPEEYVVLPPRG